MSFWIGEPGLRIGVMWSTFEFDLKGFILARLNGLKLEGWGSCTLTCSLIKSYFWRSKSFPMGRNNLGGSRNAQNWLFQMPVKTTSMWRDRWELSNDASFASNRHYMKNLFNSEVLRQKKGDVASIPLTLACWHGSTIGCHMLHGLDTINIQSTPMVDFHMTFEQMTWKVEEVPRGKVSTVNMLSGRPIRCHMARQWYNGRYNK